MEVSFSLLLALRIILSFFHSVKLKRCYTTSPERAAPDMMKFRGLWDQWQASRHIVVLSEHRDVRAGRVRLR
jgi:hypothetical protein